MRHQLPAAAAEQFERLLTALAAEPDPPTTVREPQAALDAHIADSLAGLEVPALIKAKRIADLGSGAGFPGLVLAIALPEAQVELIESAARKCAVIDRLGAAAGIANAQSVPKRVEDWATSEGRAAYDAATARALASLPVLVEYAAPLLRDRGTFVAWKGRRDPDEEAAGDRAAEQVGLALLEVRPVKPFPRAERRHLYVYSKVGETPDRFPRRAGIARKRPLA